ncbi:hypothetical protein C1922_02260 [Stenotrophomonas sp. ZAC14D2_NAIMI4_7]|uniref:XVIPCD domain-containing protein n=1 Tax=Stenotrophomonas sp. ZAC14D2_NAIMI4_7 TaxID=2072405 RepID=UPI000D542634|nr:XVIPCD domain-containing protein [Stenotrophomonas sp. ZAC14D2_NAIMI4_7]AWH16232.1 hypothetical protein C1922_02260 [Stenotrophomonas sp. ZAC14D2_NAIMI4_7]
MKAVDARVEPLLSNLSRDPRLPKGAEDVIRQAIVESPYLHALLGDAAEKSQIGAIKVSHGEHNGGHFEAGKDGQPGTVYISATNFTEWSGPARLGVVTEVLGHEAMHGVLTPYRDEALSNFRLAYGAAMTRARQNFDERVDVTAEARPYLDWGRKEEAMAEISGLRSLNSRIRNFSPGASDAELELVLARSSTSRCIDRSGHAPQLAAGISYEDLATLPHKDGPNLTPAVEKCFYDGPASLGRKGDSDYRNYYGASAISSIALGYEALWKGRPPAEIRVDLRELGLDPRQLERNGLDLGKMKVFPIIDLGKDGYGRIELNNTSSLTRVPGEKADRAVGEAPRSPGLLSAGDQALFDQIRGKVETLDRANGRTFDETSERLSASLLAAAKGAGITRADHILLSKQTENLPGAHNIFVVQGDLTNPAAMRTHVATAEAAQRPVQESMSQVEALGQRQEREQAAEMQRAQDQQQRVSSPSL